MPWSVVYAIHPAWRVPPNAELIHCNIPPLTPSTQAYQAGMACCLLERLVVFCIRKPARDGNVVPVCAVVLSSKLAYCGVASSTAAVARSDLSARLTWCGHDVVMIALFLVHLRQCMAACDHKQRVT